MKNAAKGNRRWVWGLAAASIALFALLLVAITDHDSATFIKIVAIAALPIAFFAGGSQLLLKKDDDQGVSAGELLTKITGGDLTFGNAEIERTASSEHMSAAIRGLVLSLERTIRRFSQLTDDVKTVSEQVSRRARVLSRSAGNQLSSTEATSTSVNQIDRSIKSVQASMENLSLNAEETSTSILEMSASIEEVGRIADTLAEFVDETASAIEEMIASINEVATNTESFSSFAIQTASSMVQMNATTEEIGRSAKRSSEMSRQVTDAANEGREAVTRTVEGMRKIEASVEEAKTALNALGERSLEIGEIVRVIDEIAGQTNLLALNAAIIAAQAGERGKGFAVVADEIRDLSERTSASTDEIRTLIQNVQRGVERTVGQMTVSSTRVGEGVSLAARAERVLEKILDLTERSNDSITEIANATEEQTRGSSAATAAIEEVTKMVQQTASATQQQSQTSRKIGEQAAVVRDYTKHLRRAMEEQESGSQAISKAMDNIMEAVSTVVESTSILTHESTSIVQAMASIEQSTRENSLAVSDMNAMAGTLRQESSLLSKELQRFKLPLAEMGGTIRTATVVPHKFTLDPVHCQFMAIGYINKAIHETLVQFGEGAELIPALADRWEILNGGLLYRFHIRDDAFFHNGRAVSADDIRQSFLRLMLPAVNSGGRWIMKNVRGAQEVMEGRSKDASGLRVIDARTIEIELTDPLAFFLLLLSMPETGIIPVEETLDAEKFRMRSSGAGPFKVIESTEGDRVVMKRHSEYYDPSRPHIEELIIRLDLKSAKEVTEAFLHGDLEIAHGVPLSYIQELREKADFAPYILDTVTLHTSYLSFDCASPPFNRPEVRQAFCAAINRERINQTVFSGMGVLADSLLPPGLLGYEATTRTPGYDPDNARNLLQRAGFSSGFTVEYRTWDTDEFFNSGAMPLIIQDLAAIGVRVEVGRTTAAEARERLRKPKHGAIFAGNWYADFPDSDNFFFVFFHTDGSLPGINYRIPEIVKVIEEARVTTDIDRRAQIYTELNEHVAREVPVIPLFHDRFFVIYKPHVRGLRTYMVPPPVRYDAVWLEK